MAFIHRLNRVLSLDPVYPLAFVIILMVSLPLGLLATIFVPLEYVAMALGLLILAPLGLLMIVRPQILLVATVVIFPIERADFFDVILPGNLTIAKVMGSLLLGALLFNIIFRKQKFRFFDDVLDYFVCLFGVALLVSSVTSAHIDSILGEVDQIFRLIAFYVAVKNLADDPRIFYMILLGWYLTSVYASIRGVYDAMTLKTVWGGPIRAAGINEHSTYFALESVMVLPLGIYLLMISRSIQIKALYAVSLGIVVLGIILSGSRGGMIALGVVFVMMLLRHPKGLQILVIVSILFVSSIQFWPENIRSRYLGTGGDFQNSYEEGAQQSTERRTSYFVYGLEIIAQHPIVGAGYRSFASLYPLSEYAYYDNPLEAHETYRVAHNIFIEVTVGTGLIGLVALVGMIIAAWRAFALAARLAPVNSITWAAANALKYSLIAFTLASIFLSSEQFKQLWFLLGMASALVHYAKVVHLRDAAPAPPASRRV